LTFSILIGKLHDNMARERMSERLLSGLQVIRTQRARAGEDPCHAPFDAQVAFQLDLNRLREVEARRQRRMARVLKEAIR
jgi:hypothetical protein